MLRLALRNVFRNPRRSVLTLLAISMGLLSSNLLASLARGLSTQLIEDAIYTLTGHIQIHAPQYLSDPVVEHRFELDEALQNALAADKVEHWAARVRVPAVVMSERDSLGVTLVGIDPSAERGLSFISEAVSSGRMISGVEDDGVVLGKRLAEQLQTDLGKRIVVMGQDVSGGIADRGFRIVGLYEAELAAKEKAYIFVGRQVAQQLFGMDEHVSEIALRAPGREEVAALHQELEAVVPELDVQTWRTLEPLVTALVKVQSGFLYIWFGIVIVTISCGLINSMFMAVYERTRELGLYQALGMSPRQIRSQIVAESFTLLCLGAVLGNAATFAVLVALHEGIDLSAFARGTEMFGAKSVVHLRLYFSDSAIANVAALLVGTLASLYPAWRASKLEPAVALGR